MRVGLARHSALDALGNYDAASEHFSSSRLRKSRSISPPSGSIDLPAVCDLFIPDARERQGEVASPPDEHQHAGPIGRDFRTAGANRASEAAIMSALRC